MDSRRRSSSASIASRVVPGSSVTIARSTPRSALNRLDFPAFGRPAITVSAPSRSNSPSGAWRSSASSSAARSAAATATRSGATGPSSSSGKSMSYASRASISSTAARRLSIRRDRPRSRANSAASPIRVERASMRSSGRLGLDEVELPVQVGAAGELAGLGRAGAGRAGGVEQQRGHHGATVAGDLQHVLARERGRPREPGERGPGRAPRRCSGWTIRRSSACRGSRAGRSAPVPMRVPRRSRPAEPDR